MRHKIILIMVFMGILYGILVNLLDAIQATWTCVSGHAF